MMVDQLMHRNLLLIICLFMTTDIRNCSGNFSRSMSSTPVGTTEIEIKSKTIGWNTDGTASVAKLENMTDAIGWNTDGTLTVTEIENKTDAIVWNTVGTLTVADYNGSEQTTDNTRKNIVNQNGYTISDPSENNDSKHHSTNFINVFRTRLYSDIEQTTRFLYVAHLQTEYTLNDTSMNKSSAATVKKIEKIMFASTERRIFSSSLNKSWSPTTTEGMDYMLSTSTHRNMFNPSNSNSAESLPPSSPVEFEDKTVDSGTNGREITTTSLDAIALMALRDNCAKFGTCEYMSRYASEFHLCHCDNTCTLYDDCCINSNFTRESDTTGKRFQCAIMEKSNRIFSDIGIFVVDTCPDSYMISERYKLCNNNLSIAGPYVVDINGTVYKNKFCAECHNVFNYTSFTVKIILNHRKTDKQYKGLSLSEYIKAVISNNAGLQPMEYLGLATSNPQTEYMLIPPYGTTGRSCIIYKEPQLNDTVECTDYVINPIRTNIVNGTLYRNSFCKRDDINKPSMCFGTFLRRIRRHDAQSLAVLFSFSPDIDRACNDGEQKVILI